MYNYIILLVKMYLWLIDNFYFGQRTRDEIRCQNKSSIGPKFKLN